MPSNKNQSTTATNASDDENQSPTRSGTKLSQKLDAILAVFAGPLQKLVESQATMSQSHTALAELVKNLAGAKNNTDDNADATANLLAAAANASDGANQKDSATSRQDAVMFLRCVSRVIGMAA